MRKPTICMGENKDADQLRGNREADQRLCFRYTDRTFPPPLIPKLSRFYVSSVTVQAGLCWTWLKTQIVGFFMHRLILLYCYIVITVHSIIDDKITINTDNIEKFKMQKNAIENPFSSMEFHIPSTSKMPTYIAPPDYYRLE